VRDDSEAIDNDRPVATPEETSMNPSTIATRLSFLSAAAAMATALFASAAGLAGLEREAAVAHLGQAAAASPARVLIAAGTPDRR
jgi:hypothetical protein